MSQRGAPTPADEEATRAGRSRKDTRAWCRGKAGRLHQLAVAVPSNAFYRACEWRAVHFLDGRAARVYYICRHVELCTDCGKIFRRHHARLPSGLRLRSQECPQYTPPAEDA